MRNFAPMPMSSPTLVKPFAARMGCFAALSENDRRAAERLIEGHARTFPARRDFAREGEPATALYIVLDGWAARTKMLPDGRRQIVGLLLPGDICDLNIFMLGRRDHSLCAITALRAAEIDERSIERLMQAQPGLARGLRAQELVNASIQREWALSLGQRTAYERLAHLMCEIFFRQRAVGLADGLTCDFPITQIDLGEATGLTAVHVNRTLQALRGGRLIELKGRRLTISDLPALANAGLFSPDYLHLGPGFGHAEPHA